MAATAACTGRRIPPAREFASTGADHRMAGRRLPEILKGEVSPRVFDGRKMRAGSAPGARLRPRRRPRRRASPAASSMRRRTPPVRRSASSGRRFYDRNIRPTMSLPAVDQAQIVRIAATRRPARIAARLVRIPEVSTGAGFVKRQSRVAPCLTVPAANARGPWRWLPGPAVAKYARNRAEAGILRPRRFGVVLVPTRSCARSAGAPAPSATTRRCRYPPRSRVRMATQVIIGSTSGDWV